MSIERIKKLNKAIIALNDEMISKASLYKIIEMITDELSKEQFTEEVMQNIVESVMGQVRVPEDGKDYILSDEDLQFIISEVSELIDDGTDYIITEQDIEDITQRVSQLVKDGKDGKDYIITSDDYKNIAELVEIEIPEYEIPEQPTPDDIRDMLETLQGDDRLDISAIKGFDEILRKLKTHNGNVTIGNRGIQDAPRNGITYGRNNGEWVINWEYLATNWTTEPTLNTSITGGDVYNYTLNGTTRYRFVPSTYDATQDAFYKSFDGTTLSELIIARG